MPPFLRNLPAICLLGALISSAKAQSPPATFTRSITTGSQSVSVDFALHPIRSTNFEVLVQQPDGSYLTHSADVPRTYHGTVTGYPGATAIGLLRADDTLLARISFEDGKTWTSTGGTASASGSGFTPAWPTTVVSSGGAGSTVFAAEVGIDSTFNHFTACGGTVAAVVEQCEFSVMSTNMVYLRDAAILHRIGKIIVRADAAQDPYAPDAGSTSALLPHQRTLWNAGAPMGSTHDVAAVIHSAANGGLAYVGTIGTSSRYSANDSDANGDFSVVWRHEVGHNWSSSHYEGGGNPEGSTIMSNNSLSRFSSSELRKIIAHRNSKTSILDNLGSYAFALPPRANQDAASFLRNTATRIDVLANDSDSNGQALALLSFDSTTDLGGTLARSTGTGPGGRDEILYTPPPALAAGTDWFKYRIQDSSGMQAVGHGMLRPRSEVIALSDHWPLNDASGTIAANAIRDTQNGSHESGTLVNQNGANTVTRKGAYYDGSNDQTSIPAPGYNTNTLTFTTWIKRNGAQNANASIIFSRAGSSVSGFHFGTTNELRYTWDGGGFTWNSGIVPPDNVWCLAAMCVSPTGTTLHLRTPSGIQSATNSATQSAEAFNGTMYLGWDPNSSTRRFKGWLDDVRVYKATLTATDIESLYQQALNPPAIALTAPLAGSSVPPLNIAFAATVGSLPEAVDSVSFVENESALATATSAPWQALLASITPGSHTVTARAAFGDWGYLTDSAPVAFTALPAPVPVVTVTASLPASKRGPVSGSFTVARDHPIGDLTIGLTIGGTAVPGADYTAISNSITLPAGVLSQNIVINPIASAPDGLTENVVLTLNGGAGHTLGSPSSATLVINDHITSIADGEWDLATTWNSGAPAPTSGTQNSGEGYSVANTVTSNDTLSNSQALVAGSLRVKSGGILDLARLHASTNQNVSYNLPATAIESGGTIRFRCSTGSSTHTLAAAVSMAGNTTLRINAGSYDNDVNLTGTLSGGGTIAVLSDSNAGAGTYVRQVSVNKANNPFAGNWTVNHTGGGDELGALRAGAANALGTGTVTVGTRAQLINDASAGLNSLDGVVMNGTTSSLLLNQPWTNTATSLALTGGTPVVQLGNAASSIGDLSGTAGSILGTGVSSSLTVNQSGDAVFAGNLGTSLKFNKSGPAALTLAGGIDSSLALTLTAGSLGLPAPQTIASLVQTGGGLRLALPAVPTSAPLTVSGAFSRSAGNIVVDVTAPPLADTPYTLIRYQGVLTGVPAVLVNDSSGSGMIATVSAGSGSDSSVTVTFSPPAPPQFTLSYAAGPNGSLSGEVAQTVIEGNDGSPVTAVPAPGYTFVQWSDGLTNSIRTDTEVGADISVTASFAIGQYTLTYSAGPHGSVSGPSPQVVNHGDDAQTVTAVPAPGAFFAGWSDGLSTAVRTDANVTSSRNLTANFVTAGNAVSIATGSSASGATWDLNQPAPTSGPQGAGLNWTVENFAVTSNNPFSNNQALIGGSLVIAGNGVLDLARTHDSTVQTAFYDLPPVTLNGPATIRFRASNGSSSHLLGAPVNVSGTGTLRISGGNYGNEATLSGPLAGTGTIAVVSESNASAVFGSVRQITISSADNPFSGNWTVAHTAAGDDFGALRASAANALGSATVTVGTRGRLINSAVHGLDSLTAVTLNGGDSRLVLSQPWTNPAASLVLAATSAAVDIADAASSIGDLSGTGGTITGSGSSSRLNVDPATDATFGGNFGNELQFSKAGAATLTLTGTHTHTGLTTIAGGVLQIGSGGTIGSLGGGGVSIAAAGTLRFHRGGSASAIPVSNAISGTGTLAMRGSGLINEGSFSITGNNTAFGGILEADDARLHIDNYATAAGTAAIRILDGGQLYLQTAGTFPNAVRITGSGWQETAGYLGAIRLQNGVDLTGSVELAGTARIATHNSSGTVSGNISGAYELELANLNGTGAITLAGPNNTFSGGLMLGPSASHTLNVTLAAASEITAAAGTRIRIANEAAAGTATQIFNVDGAVDNDGSLYVGRPAVLDLRTGATWDQTGATTIHAHGGYSSTLNVRAGATFTSTSLIPIVLNGADANTGQARLNIDGTFVTHSGFQQTTSPSTGYGRIELRNGGTLKLGGGVADLTTGIQFALGTGGGTIDTNGFDATISASLTGENLTKQGAGRLDLTGANSHTGNTLVAAGTLAGTGSSTSALTVAGGAVLAAGSGVFRTGSAWFQSGAVFAVQLTSNAATSGRLQAAGAVTITAGAALALTDSGSSTLPQGLKLVLIDYSGQSLVGNFSGLADNATLVAGSNSFILDYDDTLGGTGSFVTLTVDNPEPYELWIDSFTGLTDPADKDSAADPDDDGLVNGVEFVLGSPPDDGTPANLPSAVRSGNNLVFTYTRRKDAVAAGFVPEVEATGELVSQPWTLVTPEMTQVIDQETTEKVIVTIPLPGASAMFFARLKVTF